MCVSPVVRHRRYASQGAESLFLKTSAGAALMVSTNKMTFLLERKFKTWLSDAICHSSDSFIHVWVLCGFPPHGTVLSHQLPVPLSSSLSLKMETYLAVHQLFHEKCVALVWRLLAFWHMRVDTWRRDSLARWGQRPTKGRLFECHIFICLHPYLTQSFFSVW